MNKINWQLSPGREKANLFEKIKWYEVGGFASLLVLMYAAYLFLYMDLTMEAILVFNFFSLLLHQFEEYGYPGWFPGMFNRWVFGSGYSLHYPLNKISSWIVNVFFGWGIYVSSILWASQFPALGMACILLTSSNILAHFGFSIKARKLYNPGLLTSLFLFLPTVILFFIFVDPINSFSNQVFWNGILLGVISISAVPLTVLAFANEKSRFEFGARHEVPEFRKFKSFKED